MDLQNMYYSLDYVFGNRLKPNTEQREALQISLTLLKNSHKFNRVLFWGKILGDKNDYFIALGVGEDEMSNKKYLYSLDCIDWHMLPSVNEAMISEVTTIAKGFFIGEPSYQYRSENQQPGEGQETEVNEVLRLTVTVHTIDKEVAVVPRGAYVKNRNGTVQTNSNFEGLNTSEAANLSNYLHFAEPINLKKKSISEKNHLKPSIDFLDPLSEDIPKGSWSKHFEHGGRVCVIRSLLWIGLTFFHMPETPEHGYIYIGDGLKNLDLPFML